MKRLSATQAEGRVGPLPARPDPRLVHRIQHHAARDEQLNGLQAALCDVVREALGALVREELSATPAHVRGRVRDVLRRVRRARRLQLTVHPEDAPLLGDLDALGDAVELRTAVELHTDPGLERGSALVESDLGDLDARLEIQVDRLARTLARAAESGGSERSGGSGVDGSPPGR